VAVTYLIVAAILVVLTVTAIRPPLTHRSAAVRPPWFPVMVVTEVAPLLTVVTCVLIALGMVLGVFSGSLGKVTASFLVVSLVALGWIIGVSLRTTSAVRRSLPTEPAHRPRVSVVQLLRPDPYRIPAGVRVDEGIEYADGLLLDMYRSTIEPVGSVPAIVQIHGGSWGGGNRRQQARPLLHSMAARGWASIAIDYPLVPDATFPENIRAIHLATAWISDNAPQLGVDPEAIYITGGSSGAHLASLAALTTGQSRWGMPARSPMIAGAVVLYGVYDLLDRHDIRDEWPVIPLALMKADPTKEPQRFIDASPIDQVHEAAPPFLIIHGKNDSLVPYATSEYFAEALESVSRNPVDLVLLPGASHAFDAIPSIRTQILASHVGDYLDRLVSMRRG
jgi:acetyl esterase/lipase